ncbi:MAG: hypothetical protein NTX65_16170 [Ignavibacteriales bacterium]|nr:hypothetical protein [Ignavibacteriales bacterium]
MKLEIIAAIILSVSIFSNAQVKNNELSFSGTIGAFKSNLEASGNYSYTSEESLNYYIMTNTRFGFFLIRNFGIILILL